jgi:predicted esterase
VQFVFPAAPTAAVTISGGALQTSWFDIFDWPIGVSARDDRDGLLRSTRGLLEIVAGLEAEGVPADKIVIGGFSQGGAVTLLACHRYPKTLAGCVCLSGWLTLKEEWAGARVKDNATPVFWGHGEADPVVLPEQVAAGSEVINAQGPDIKLDARMYPMGHSSHPSEMSDVSDFLAAVLGP